ncbi:GlsB/YeaQ/YmgE family stress response membrane protein [Streptomyces sp. NPDC008001]|uniref:GlsB/YeaQ/YmgE family stress response membrane protein n=1 Tax=Streptomyces sp. NPDC008001 TaxID=3364804 RepID=UPI0036E8BEE8
MEISGILSALVIGFLIGLLGRLVLPGRQHVPLWLMILIGIAAALAGTAIAHALHVSVTSGLDWIEWLIQIALAAIGVGAVDRARAHHH